MTEPHVAVLSRVQQFLDRQHGLYIDGRLAPHKVKNGWRSLIRPPGKKLRLLLMPTKRM